MSSSLTPVADIPNFLCPAGKVYQSHGLPFSSQVSSVFLSAFTLESFLWLMRPYAFTDEVLGRLGRTVRHPWKPFQSCYGFIKDQFPIRKLTLSQNLSPTFCVFWVLHNKASKLRSLNLCRRLCLCYQNLLSGLLQKYWYDMSLKIKINGKGGKHSK